MERLLGEAPSARRRRDCQRIATAGQKAHLCQQQALAPRAAYAAKLTRLGIPTQEDEIITSAFVLAHHLATTMPDLRLYVVGEDTSGANCAFTD